MTRVLTRNNRRAILNGRLVSTANGAPCCCGGAELCPCGSLQASFLYTGCDGANNKASFPFPPYRRVIVQTQYQTQRRELVTGNPPGTGDNREIQQGLMGVATLCFVDSSMAVVAGESAWFNRRAGTPNYNLENVEGPAGAFRIGIPAAAPGGYVLGPFLYWGPNGSVANRNLSPSPDSGLVAQPRRQCNYAFDYDDGVTTIRERYTYTDSPSGGMATAEILNRTQSFGITELVEASSTLVWTRQIDLCDGSGGGTGDRPGGCAGCGDASRLTII